MTSKERSKAQEEQLRKIYGGRLTSGSGNTAKDKGDLRVQSSRCLFEAKTTGEPGSPKRSRIVNLMEKIADEAWASDLEPVLALQYYCPGSPISNKDGYVNLVIRLLGDDAERELLIGH